MHSMNHEEGRYRVLLVGIGDDTEEKRETFCRNISEIYGIPFPLLKKVVDHCPTVLKKNLSLEKAQALARTLTSFGALVSIEEKRDSSAVFLEFHGAAPPRVALESSYLRKTEGGTWNVIGRARNISEEDLADLWVLIQLFDDSEELLTFEEIPFPINPLPPGEASPFKVIFEGDLPIRRVSLTFKNASGVPVSALDRRSIREWVELKLDLRDDEEYFSSSSLPPVEGKEETPPAEARKLSEEISPPPEAEFSSIPEEEKPENDGQDVKRDFGDDSLLATEKIPSERALEPAEGHLDLVLEIEPEPETERIEEIVSGREGPQQAIPPPLERETDLRHTEIPSPQQEIVFPETRFDVSIFEEATKLLEEISENTPKRVSEEPPSFPWIEDFRNSIETYYQTVGDLISVWFERQRKKAKFADAFHSLLTILAHARFNQKNQSDKALENTQKIFELLRRSNVPLEDIPALEGTPFFTGENWRELFHRAIPKLSQVARDIIGKKRWSGLELERLIQIVPHMSDKNSRMAIRWVHQWMSEVIEIDLSNVPLSIGEGFYRVGARLGVVDPHFDYYRGRESIGHLKLQAFAKSAYPEYPIKIEDPMNWVGMKEREGGQGHCLPTQPRCNGCLFESFCSKLFLDFDPSEKGMAGGKEATWREKHGDVKGSQREKKISPLTGGPSA